MKPPEVIIRVDRKALVFLCAVVLVAALARLLWSEMITLVTTYPVPSGIYNQIITTGNSGTGTADTTLNRNAGNTILIPPTNAAGKVGIGTSAPTAKLSVDGDVEIFRLKLTGGGTCNASSKDMLGLVSGTVQFCDGTAWKSLGGGGGACDGPPGTTCTISGNNPTCPAGTTAINYYWQSKSCSGANSGGTYFTGACTGNSPNYCTTSNGWSSSRPTCYSYYTTTGKIGGYYGPVCAGVPCYADKWTMVQCRK